MQSNLWAIYNQCTDLSHSEIDRLISELQILSDRKFEESSDNPLNLPDDHPLHPSWIEAANNISTFNRN